MDDNYIMYCPEYILGYYNTYVHIRKQHKILSTNDLVVWEKNRHISLHVTPYYMYMHIVISHYVWIKL